MKPRILMLSLSRDLAAGGEDLNEAQRRQCLYAEGFCESVDIVVKSSGGSGVRALGSAVRVHATGTSSNVGTAWRMWTRGNELIRARSCSLVVAQEPFLTGVVAALLAARWRLPLCVHYVCDFFDNEEWLRERPANRAWNVLGKVVLRRARVVRVDSPDQGARLAALGIPADSVHYVPFLQPGLARFATERTDAELRRTLLRGGDAVVLTVSRLDPQKGLDTLLSVAERVSPTVPGVRFLVVGDGPERPRFEAAIRQRGLSACIQTTGWIEFERLPSYFAAADLFLLTSRYETSARVLVLARASGVPIVTTAVSGAAELATAVSGSAIAPVGDVATLAACVEDRLVHRREARLKAAATHETVLDTYSETAIVAAMERLCLAALEPPDTRVLPKLVYVLPKFDAATEEHFLHTYGLLEVLAERVDLAVIVERSVGRAAFGRARVFRQRCSSLPPLRVLEMLWLSLRLRANGYRTFYVHYSYFGAIAAWLVTRALGGRVFYWHCVSKFFQKSGWGTEALLHRIRAELPLALTMKLVDHVVTGTPSLAALYQRTFRLPESRLRVVPNEIRPDRFEPVPGERQKRRAAHRIEPDAFVVLFVHRLAPRKGAQYLPALARALFAVVPHARLLIVGDGPSRPWLEEEIRRAPEVSARVQMLGWVPNAEIAGWYAAADAFVMPSDEEGFPRVLLECMAAGLPFVAADVGGVRDVCDALQQWSVVPRGDLAAFVTRLAELARDPSRRRALADAGRRRVHAYTTAVVAERTVQQLDLEPRGPVHPPLGAAGALPDRR